ncbi:MAG: hypothetical protein GY953_26540 [bacterium]|nr:hypothetical protein [bacterium]
MQYLARSPGGSVYFTEDSVLMAVRGSHGRGLIEMRLPGSREWRLRGTDPLPGASHYLVGNDRAGWRSRVPHFGRLRADEPYPGIAIEFYGNQRLLEYDFVVAPGADPARIRLRFAGAESMELTGAGELELMTRAGPLRQHRPVAYQCDAGTCTGVEATYEIADSGDITFRLGEYDRSLPLVIDPVVSFSTFFGGSGLDLGHAIALDQQGNVYITGTTHSPDFPITGGAVQPGFSPGQLPGDAFITKLDGDGSGIVFSTFLGGALGDVATSIAIDPAGNIVVAGRTESNDFPITFSSFQTGNRSTGFLTDGFVTKLDPNGSSLVYSTYLGGEGSDRIHALGVDATGSAYVAGSTDSSDFPTTEGAFRSASCPSLGLGGFASKFGPDGSGLVYSTLLCGSSTDEALAIAVDAQAGTAFVAGRTRSADFPITAGAFQTAGGGQTDDGFVLKLNADGSQTEFSTYLGGSAADGAAAIAIDETGSAFIAGYTRSKDFPVTAGAFQPAHADNGLLEDAFVAVLNPDGATVLRGTFLGGNASERATAIEVDSDGQVYVAGFTGSSDFPASGERCQTGYGGRRDAFALKFDQAVSQLAYSFLLGGRQDDLAHSLALDASGNAYLVGETTSSGFPTTASAFRPAYANGYRGSSDAFVSRIDDQPAPVVPCVSLNGVVNGASFLPGPLAPGEIMSIFGSGLGPAVPAVFSLSGDTIGKELAGTRVLFDGDAAPVIATSAGQMNIVTPYSVAGKDSVTVQVESGGQLTAGVSIPVASTSPALFTIDSSGRGPGAVLNQNFSVNSAANPAARGSVIQMFATGEGQTNPAGVDGLIAVGDLPAPTQPVAVTIGGVPAVVQYAGAAPRFVAGVIQVNAFVPPNSPLGSSVPVILHFGDNSSPTSVTVAIE